MEETLKWVFSIPNDMEYFMKPECSATQEFCHDASIQMGNNRRVIWKKYL